MNFRARFFLSQLLSTLTASAIDRLLVTNIVFLFCLVSPKLLLFLELAISTLIQTLLYIIIYTTTRRFNPDIQNGARNCDQLIITAH